MDTRILIESHFIPYEIIAILNKIKQNRLLWEIHNSILEIAILHESRVIIMKPGKEVPEFHVMNNHNEVDILKKQRQHKSLIQTYHYHYNNNNHNHHKQTNNQKRQYNNKRSKW